MMLDWMKNKIPVVSKEGVLYLGTILSLLYSLTLHPLEPSKRKRNFKNLVYAVSNNFI